MPKDKADETTPEQPVMTQTELMAELQTALTKGDFKAVTAISRKIDTLTRAAEKAESFVSKHDGCTPPECYGRCSDEPLDIAKAIRTEAKGEQ